MGYNGIDINILELEKKYEVSPDDIDIILDLADGLMERHHNNGQMKDLKRLREIVLSLPEENALLNRAYLIAQEKGDYSEYLVKYINAINTPEDPSPITNNELNNILFLFSHIDSGICIKLANSISSVWPNCAAEMFLRGDSVRFSSDPDLEKALDYYFQALYNDKSFWLAICGCADIYYEKEIWASARNFYLQTLIYENNLPDVHFNLAWCFGKIKNLTDEEKYYRSCLELDPIYPYARNNLGFSLIKQKRYDEALEVFKECIVRKVDGIVPFINMSRVYIKLNKYTEALEVLQRSSETKRLSKSIQKEIEKLQRITDNDRISSNIIARNEDQISIEQEIIEQESFLTKRQSLGTKNIKQRYKGAAPSERSLESLLEEQIIKEGNAFGCNLRMFDPLDGPYGRQLKFIDSDGQGKRIDLLVEDVDTNDLIVIELKQKESDKRVVDQISSYIEWVRENIASGRKVRGIICLNKASDSLRRHAAGVPNLSVYEYRLSFLLNLEGKKRTE